MALAEMQAAVTVSVVKRAAECPSSADFFSKPGQKSIDIVSEGVYYSGIIDEKAPETVPLALDGDRMSAADFFMRETRGEFCMRGREMKWRYSEQLFSFQI